MLNPIYTISTVAEILNADANLFNTEARITHLVIDSRSVLVPENSLFFALLSHRDGHEFIKDAYSKEIRNFVITDTSYLQQYRVVIS